MKRRALLGDIWFTAWQQAPPDTFLKSALTRRNWAPSGSGNK